MKLYDYPRSSASHRVRIALHWKGLAFERVHVDLLRGAQCEPDHRARSPQGLVPVLEVDGRRIPQSLAILEYLEELQREPPLLPDGPAARARVRAIALAMACEIHPLQNLRVRQYLEDELAQPEAARRAWLQHWITTGLAAVEALVTGHPETGRFCHGDRPSLADVCLVPQLLSARRWECALDAFPTLLRIEGACEALPAFAAALPDRS